MLELLHELVLRHVLDTKRAWVLEFPGFDKAPDEVTRAVYQ